jgi:hypothetical protein
MSRENFQVLIRKVTKSIAGRTLNKSIEIDLNNWFPANGELVDQVQRACESAIDEGWMCGQEFDGIKFGRVIKAIDGFSVDVVHMKDVIGPHHRHPKGEIDLIMPIEGDAKFDTRGAGWVVYEPNSAHCPTVTNGTALVLYLLPDGEIEFTRQ